ncbi:hypothetical protein ACFLST_01235 [Chloroflexota bacterium]
MRGRTIVSRGWWLLSTKGATRFEATMLPSTSSSGGARCQVRTQAYDQRTKTGDVLAVLWRNGAHIGAKTRPAVFQGLRPHDVEMITRAEVQRITKSGAVCAHNGERQMAEAETEVEI